MSLPRQVLFVAFSFAISQATPQAYADGVSETNYLHIDPDHAIIANGVFAASRLKRKVIAFDGLKIGARLSKGVKDYIQLFGGSNEFPSVAVLFEEDVCAIGAKVKIDTKGVSNGVQVVFLFLARDGTEIDRKVRWPASGTTLQSFSSDNFASRFLGVEISADRNSGLRIMDVLALPCAAAIS